MKKLNLAFTFYGGVSLAVYEAGIAEEFIRFIQFFRKYKKEHPECKISDPESGISDIDVSVISGSSAGGLAAVMMSTSLLNADDPTDHIEEMRRIWFDVADISTLQFKSGKSPSSILDNDILEEEIGKFLQIRKKGNGLCKNTKILVTGTNMQGFFDAVPIEQELSLESDYKSEAFPTIRHTEVFPFDADYIRKAEVNEVNRHRIAKAARITSSFPAAFPPQYALSPGFSEDIIGRMKDQQGSPIKHPLHFWYFDGGVLDNKPLGHAIDHIATSTLEGDWWYFFIEPRPGNYSKLHAEWGGDSRKPPDPASTVQSVFETRGAETIYYDLRRIQKLNHQVLQINNFIGDIWEMICHGDTNSVRESMNRLKDNVSIARVHRYLPDYMKCVSMLNYSFFQQKNPGAELQGMQNKLRGRHKEVVSGMQTLELRNIVSTLIAQIRKEKIFKKSDRESILRILEKYEGAGLPPAPGKDYDDAVKEVRKSQLLFRQIAFWIEDDFRAGKDLGQTERKPSSATWQALIDAWKELDAALSNLNTVSEKIFSEINTLIGDDRIVNLIRCYVMLNESLHAASGVDTRTAVRVIKIYHNEAHGRLAGAQIANFGGFLDRRWRKHDYLIGKKDAREMLRKKVEPEVFNDDFWSTYENWLKEEEGNIKETYQLEPEDNVLLKKEEMDIENLLASRIIPPINSILKTSQKLLRKYQDESKFYSVLWKLRTHWFLSIFSKFLWLVRQATAQPVLLQDAKDMSSLSRLKSGMKSRFGFIVIGIIIGLLISFFLPDMFRDAIDRLKEAFVK